MDGSDDDTPGMGKGSFKHKPTEYGQGEDNSRETPGPLLGGPARAWSPVWPTHDKRATRVAARRPSPFSRTYALWNARYLR